MRKADIVRKTKETRVVVKVELDGRGKCVAETGIAFLDHMLDSFAAHSMVDIRVKAKGDLQHHLVEDVSLALGEAISRALGDRKGLTRFGYAIVPMDDALVTAAVDLVRRPYASINLKLKRVMVEDAPREDLEHFVSSLVQSIVATVHIETLKGSNDHHKFEASVKALALALRQAASRDERRKSAVPSSKGSI